VFVWRKKAERRWVKAHEDLLKAHAAGQLVIVRRPGRKRLELEIVCRSRSDSSALLKEFGGRIEALPRNWLERFAPADSKRIKIGKRLIVVRSINELQRCSVRCPQRRRSSRHRARPDAPGTAHATGRTIKPVFLVMPASLAFGTGEHATTGMSLRFLEQLSRGWKNSWSLLDLGTGSGILALAAKCFGAGSVTGIDNDPAAISVAKSNVRLNKIRGASFRLADLRKQKPAQKTDVITANLYNDLLIKILPKLNTGRWLVLSGILRSQQHELGRALQRNQYDIVEKRRRGKWVAILATRMDAVWPRELKTANFCSSLRPPLQ
jgi:ribosomal protein L11 methyltransferase